MSAWLVDFITSIGLFEQLWNFRPLYHHAHALNVQPYNRLDL